jgi:hypothetical protein
MNKETLIEKLLTEKAENNNTIDLNAYALGLDAMYEAFVLHDVSNRRDLLCAFFKYFRDNGEANIGMTIEEFVDGFLSTQ